MPDLPDQNQSKQDPLNPVSKPAGQSFVPRVEEEKSNASPPDQEQKSTASPGLAKAEDNATGESQQPELGKGVFTSADNSQASGSPAVSPGLGQVPPPPPPSPSPSIEPEAKVVSPQPTAATPPPPSTSFASPSTYSPKTDQPPSGNDQPPSPGAWEGPPSVSPPSQPQAYHPGGRSPFSILKKVLPILLILVVVAGLAFAIFRYVVPQVTEVGLGKKEIVYWGLWEPESVMEVVLPEWEKIHPDVTVKYEKQEHFEYRQRLAHALERGEGPDVFRFHNTWTPMLKDYLDPVPASVMSASDYQETFYPVIQSSLRSGSDYLGVPLEVDTLALFYNQDIFIEAGVQPPANWDELRQLATILTVRDDKNKIQRAGIALGTTENVWHWSDVLGLLIVQNGGDPSNPTDKLAQDALTYYTSFRRIDRVWDETLPNSVLAFATGKAAMMFGYSWDVFEVLNINPDLNFKIVPVPQIADSDTAWASFWVEGVSNKSLSKSLSWEFLKFMSSQEIMEKLYQAQSQLGPQRPFGEPYSRISMASKLQDDPLVSVFVNQAPKAKSWYLCSRTFDNGINDNIIEYYADAVNSVVDGRPVDRSLGTAAEGIKTVLGRYNLAPGKAKAF